MVGIVENVAPLCVINEIPGIAKCFLSEDKENGGVRIYLLLFVLTI